jgi:BCD family chlorophyll transporter-like MFS transporter
MTGDLTLGWIGIIRLGLVQTALGAIVVLTTSTLNRVMVVELALPAMLPGALVGLHYALQVLRPRWGHGSDTGGRRTPWIVGGMASLAIGGVMAAAATAWMTTFVAGGMAMAVLAFILIGLGVGSCGTSLLVLLATHVAPHRRAAAATIVWVMMIAGFVVTTAVAGHFLDPFSPARLVVVMSSVAAIAFATTLLALGKVEHSAPASGTGLGVRAAPPPFRASLAQVWREDRTRRFAVFVFTSMLAYSAQDLILEPFAGTVFGLTPGQSTQLSSVQHGGVLAGLIVVPLLRTALGVQRRSLLAWTVVGCLGSAVALAMLVFAAIADSSFPLIACVFALGLTNGVFAVAAIGLMMEFVGSGRERREGVRMGLWGAAQATAFGLGGFAGTAASDIASRLLESPAQAYATVFAGEAVLFVIAALLALRCAAEHTAPALAGKTLVTS